MFCRVINRAYYTPGKKGSLGANPEEPKKWGIMAFYKLHRDKEVIGKHLVYRESQRMGQSEYLTFWLTRTRVPALEGRIPQTRGSVGKIEGSAEALRVRHHPPSFPPNKTPLQSRVGDQADKIQGKGNPVISNQQSVISDQ